jgi:Ni/Co efflux regulator RcnB
MITAIVLLAVVAFVAILAAVSFANLARKRLRISQYHEANAFEWQKKAEASASQADRYRLDADRLRASIIRRADRISARDLSDAQCRRILRAIVAHGKPSPATPGSIDELMPNVLPEASE